MIKKKLLEQIRQVIAADDVGTLFLGKGRNTRQLFFGSEEIHLVDAGQEARFIPAVTLFDAERVEHVQLSDLFTKLATEKQGGADLLHRVGLLSDKNLAAYREMEALEEILGVADRSGEHYLFESGNVPESLLLTGDKTPHGLPKDAIVPALEKRLEEIIEQRHVFPRLDEIPILSERGLEARANPRHWLFAQVALLVDGFRNVHRILDDSPFFPHRTLQILVAAAHQGWLKKSLLREIEDIDIEELTPAEARDMVERFESAANMAVDDLPVREQLFEVLLLAGRTQDAVREILTVGEIYEQGARIKQAIAAYQRGLSIVPESELFHDKLYRLHYAVAQSLREHGSIAEARERLEAAAMHRKNDFELYLEIILTHDDEDTVTRETIRWIEQLLRASETDRAVELLNCVLEQYPNSEKLRRRLVNLLLDAGDMQTAVAELDTLFAQLYDNGELERAREIFGKICRLQPGRAEHSPFPSDEVAVRRRLWLSPAFIVVAVILIALGVHQHLVYRHAARAQDALDQMLANPIPVPSSPAFKTAYRRSVTFAEQAQELVDRYAFSIWIGQFQHVALAAEKRVEVFDNILRVELDDIVSRAQEAHMLGKFDDALREYGLLEQRGDGTKWAEIAKTKIAEITRYRDEATRLLEDARAAESTGKRARAFELYREVLIEYSRSPEAKQIQLPLRVISEPLGASVRLNGSLIGTTPIDIQVDPWRPTNIELELEGLSGAITIDSPVEHEVLVELEPKKE